MLPVLRLDGQTLQIDESGCLKTAEDGIGGLLPLFRVTVQELGEVDKLGFLVLSYISSRRFTYTCLRPTGMNKPSLFTAASSIASFNWETSKVACRLAF